MAGCLWNGEAYGVLLSQLIDFPAVNHEAARKRLLEACVGRTLSLRVIELNEVQNRLILSERAASASPGERAHILAKLQSGDTVEGMVTNLCDFGAFIDSSEALRVSFISAN